MAAPEPVSRERWIGYRWRQHGLHEPAGAGVSADLLRVGIQDTPAGSARLAAELRTSRIGRRGVRRALDPGGAAFLTWSARGAPHLHAVADGDLVRRAVVPATAADAGVALGGWGCHLPVREAPERYVLPVTEAMAAIVKGPTTKPELSERLSAELPDRLTAWCGRCESRHVPDPLFRLAGGRAGLALDPDAHAPTVLWPAPDLPAFAGDDDAARTAWLAAALRLDGPSTRPLLGGRLAVDSAGLAAHLDALGAERVDVALGGSDDGSRRLLAPPDVAAAVADAEPAEGTLLVGAHDPYLKGIDKPLLVPQQRHRRELFRPLSPPGALLVDGEVAGCWRHRRSKDRLQVTVTVFERLRRGGRGALDAAADRLRAWAEVDRVEVEVE